MATHTYLFWAKLWIAYVIKHASRIDGAGDPNLLLHKQVYSFSNLSPTIPLVYSMHKGWMTLEEASLIALCEEHYTTEELDTAKLQYELAT